MQIYGAQGRSQPENNAIGGKGGYSYGQLTLNKNQNIYICCGGSGEHGTNSGYNGAECTLAQYGGGWHGGGATIIQAAFGQGAIGHVDGDFGGNGGGGWYGGGAAAFIGGGAGGSGYINTSLVKNGSMQTGVQTGNGKALVTWMPVL